VGKSATLTATIQPANAPNKAIIWSSSNSGVATVNSGIVTAVAKGSATIKAATVEGNRSATVAGDVVAGQCGAYTFPGYQPDLKYNFREDFANIDPNKFTVYLGCPQS
jgi:hypothetical protein